MQCETCTLCCKLLPIESTGSQAGSWCKNCLPGVGCTIYPVRPDECKIFSCAYHQMEKVSKDLRPDKCKIIFEKVTDRIFFGTQHPDYEITETAKRQIDQFQKQGFSVIIKSSSIEKPMAFINKNHRPQEIFDEYLKAKDGNAKLHN